MHRSIDPQGSSSPTCLKFTITGLRLLLGLALLLGFVAGQPVHRAAATSWIVTNTTSLNAAIAGANAETSGTHTITFNNTIVLTAATTAIDLQPGVTLIIEGQGYSLDGADSYRGLTINSGEVEIHQLTITSCQTVDAGGGILNIGTLTVTNSTFSGNSAMQGGGINNQPSSTLTVTNSTFSDNSTDSYGGGIINNGILTVTNSTFSGNSASVDGGGISNNSLGTLNLANTLLADNTTGGDCSNSGTMGTDVHNLIVDNDGCGTPVSTVNPGLGSLQNNGGPTLTMAIDHTSSAYNAGDNGACTALSTDQRGESRVLGGTCDIGAYEAPPIEQTVNMLIDPGDGVCDLAECTLREAIEVLEVGGTIDFESEGTLTLTSQLIIDKDLTIDGSALPSHVVLSGADSVRVFWINNSITATLQGLDITHGDANNGGGIYNDGSLIVDDCTFSNNSVTNNGGGIYTYLGTLDVTNSTFSGNSATNYGGGISNQNSTVTLTNSTFSGNTATGGGAVWNDGTLLIDNSTFSTNTATLFGGGVDNSYGTVTVTNSTFSGNSADFAGGSLSNAHGTVTSTNNTLSANSAVVAGGGIWNQNTLNLVNTIVANSTGSEDCYNTGTMGTDVHNLIENNSISHNCGTPFSSDPPNLGLLLDNGGPTLTMAIDPNSPAFNAGDSASCSSMSGDQRGMTRTNGAACDIGAYEYQIPAPVDFNFDYTSDVVVFRGGAWRFFDYETASFDHGVWTGTAAGCIPAPMDYDGDGGVEPTQLCGGAWHFYNDDGSYNKGIWTGGVAGDLPVPGDYDGDGTDDVVVWRAGAWRFFDFATAAFDHGVWTGMPPHWLGGTSLPVPMDYDGDGAADFTVWSGGPWHFYNDDGSYNKGIWTGGVAGDMPVPADYNGDITEEVVVWRGGAWRFFDFATAAFDHGVWTGAPPHWLGGTSLPSPLDYDGNGLVDFTVWSGGPWHFYNPDGSYAKGIWTGGVAGDLPISRRLLP